MNRYEKALSKIPDTLEWSLKQDIEDLSRFLLADDNLPRIFLGSGGSFSAAQLAMQLSVEQGIVAAAMTPYQYIFSGWSNLPAKVVIISAGGRNVDAINAYKTAHSNPVQEVGVILMSTPNILETMMMQEGEHNSFVYQLHNDDGFLATNSLVAYYSLFIRIFRKDEVRVMDWSFISSIENQLKLFLESSLCLSTEGWDEHNAAVYNARETDRFYVLYSPETMPIAYDLESRFSEGSLGCLQISDYRNFAHGRFNWFHQRKGQTVILALISPESKKIAEDILMELPAEIPVMRLDTDFTGSDSVMDLLMKGMYLAMYLGQRWGLDIGAPEVASFGKVIHRKDFFYEEPSPVTPAPSTPEIRPIPDSILDLDITNLARVSSNIVRGQSLWAPRNGKSFNSVFEEGIEAVIDFQPKELPKEFGKKISSKGAVFYQCQLDTSSQSDIEILERLPYLFELLDNRRCYIGCQQGLHTTDLALAIYFMFHNQSLIPDLFGHKRNGTFKCNDVMQRLNSLYATLTPELADKLGITYFNKREFQRRRKILLDANRKD